MVDVRLHNPDTVPKVLRVCNMPAPPRKHVLLREIWEAVCHRFGVFILRMLLETKMALIKRQTGNLK